MFISDFAIKRPIITIVTMLALVVFGLVSLLKLDTDEFPDFEQPILFVGVAYPGASSDVVEREVVTRIEDKLSAISGVEKLNSTSTDGFAQIIVQFALSKDVDQASQDVRDAISSVRGQLPQEILEPILQKFDPSTLPIVSQALTSTVLSTAQLTQLADGQIAGELRSNPGVAQVNVVGGDSGRRHSASCTPRCSRHSAVRPTRWRGTMYPPRTMAENGTSPRLRGRIGDSRRGLGDRLSQTCPARGLKVS